MSVNTETSSAQGQTAVLEKEGVYASLFEKINLTPASRLGVETAWGLTFTCNPLKGGDGVLWWSYSKLQARYST